MRDYICEIAFVIISVDWKYFMQGRTWLDAATQIFFDYSVGNGALAALGSYNKFHHNCFRDAILSCIVCTCTCLSAGILVFATLGNMAHLQKKTVGTYHHKVYIHYFLKWPKLMIYIRIFILKYQGL